MKSEEWILKEIEKHVDFCLELGRICKQFNLQDTNMKTFYSWIQIDILCRVLEIDSLQFWNRICHAYPNLGDVTEPDEYRRLREKVRVLEEREIKNPLKIAKTYQQQLDRIREENPSFLDKDFAEIKEISTSFMSKILKRNTIPVKFHNHLLMSKICAGTIDAIMRIKDIPVREEFFEWAIENKPTVRMTRERLKRLRNGDI
jgi:hypothetical protein